MTEEVKNATLNVETKQGVRPEDLKETLNATVSQEVLTKSIVEAEKQLKKEEIKATSNTTTVQLPSNGLINPNITEVTLRRMTTLESKTLFTSSDPNFLTTLVMHCIVDPVNITTNDLHPHDIIYLLFILRYISSPKAIEQKVICTNPRCQHEFGATVNVQELSVNYINPSEVSYTIKLPDAGDKIGFRILSEGQINECEKIAERQVRQFNIEDAEWHKAISKIAYMIVTKNDMEFETFKDKIEYLEKLSAYDFETFNQNYNDIINKFGLDRKFYATCPKCNEAVEVEAYIAPDFFRLV